LKFKLVILFNSSIQQRIKFQKKNLLNLNRVSLKNDENIFYVKSLILLGKNKIKTFKNDKSLRFFGDKKTCPLFTKLTI